MKRGLKNKAALIRRTLACIERIEYYLSVGEIYPATTDIVKDDVKTYKKYLNSKRKTRTYRTQDLIFINRLMNAERVHLKKYINDRKHHR